MEEVSGYPEGRPLSAGCPGAFGGPVLPLRLLVPLLATAIALGSCAGGSTTAVPPGFAQTASGTGTANSNAQVAVPPVGALTAGSVTLPAVTSGAGSSLSVKTSIGGSATFSSDRRGADSISNSTAFAEVTITANAPVTFTGAFTATITFVGGPTTYFGTFQDPAGNLTGTPQQTATGTTYTLTSPIATYTMAAGQSVSFDFATTKTANAPTVAGALVFGSPSLSFTTTGTAAAQTDTVTESNFAGTFTAISEDVTIATVGISGGTITVTPVKAGTTSIDVTGGTTGKITVTVTTSPVTVQ